METLVSQVLIDCKSWVLLILYLSARLRVLFTPFAEAHNMLSNVVTL